MKKSAWIIGVACVAQLANAADQSFQYHYGDQLDIAKVISVDVPAGSCAVVEAEMTYLDSKGETKVMKYLRQGADCNDR